MSNFDDKLREQGRAVSPEEKRAIVDRILTAWLASPSCRLGQLVMNAITLANQGATLEDLAHIAFNVEDDALAAMCEHRSR